MKKLFFAFIIALVILLTVLLSYAIWYHRDNYPFESITLVQAECTHGSSSYTLEGEDLIYTEHLMRRLVTHGAGKKDTPGEHINGGEGYPTLHWTDAEGNTGAFTIIEYDGYYLKQKDGLIYDCDADAAKTLLDFCRGKIKQGSPN